MNNAEIPTLLDSMLLTAIVDNRRLISEIYGRLEKMRSDMEEDLEAQSYSVHNNLRVKWMILFSIN